MSSVSSLFRPEDERLSPRAKTQVQLHRLLSLLGALLIPLFDVLHTLSNPEATDPIWARLLIGGLFAGQLVASYGSRRIRRHYVEWMRGILYLLMSWFALVTLLNRFAADYAVGLLLVYSVLLVVVGVGARTMGPVLRFAGFGLLLTVGEIALGPVPRTSPLVLLGSMFTMALVGSLAIRAHLSTQRRLRDREAHLRGLTNSLPGVAYQFHVRPDGTYGHHFVGEYAENVLGLSSEPEDFYERFVRRVPAPHRGEVVELIDGAVEREEPWRFELPFETPSGERIWLLSTSTPERRNGELVFNGVMLDITDRKEVEQALREERNRLATLFESLPTPAVRCTAEEEGFFISAANKAFEAVFGVEAPTVEGKDIDELLVPVDRRMEAKEIARRALEDGPQQVEVQRKAADGLRDFKLEVTGRSQEEGPPEVYVIYTDITEQKRREHILQDRQEKIESLYGATSLLLTADSFEAVASRTSGVLQDVFGYHLGNVGLREDGIVVPQGTTVNDRESFPSPESAATEDEDLLSRACHSGDTVVIEDVQAPGDDADRGDLCSAAAVPIGEYGAIVVGQAEKTSFDSFDLRLIEILATYATVVLDRIEREQELVEARKEAVETSRLKSDLLANISHELRTPLTSITASAETLVGTLEGGLEKFAEDIYENSQRLLKTIDSMVQLSKLEAEAYNLEREPVRLDQVTEEVVYLLRSEAEDQAIELKMDVDVPVEGRFNEGALSRIAKNLVQNAIMVTPEGGRVEIRVWEGQKEAVLEVEDAGMGINEEALPEVFEAFERDSEELDLECQGSGLGLSIVKRFVESHGGTIEVESEKGEGTCFTVRLPLGGDGEA